MVACGDICVAVVWFAGYVFSWGDGDYGKLGRGGSDGCKSPKPVDRLDGEDIIQVGCGTQFSAALSSKGRVFTWYAIWHKTVHISVHVSVFYSMSLFICRPGFILNGHYTNDSCSCKLRLHKQYCI